MTVSKMSVTDELCNKNFKSDKIFSEISRDIVSLKEETVKANNQLLRKLILENLIPDMQQNDDNFAKMYTTVMYGGSYYKRLKVGKPNEYDLNLIIKLPIKYCFLKVESEDCKPGYVKIKVKETQLNKNEKIWSKLLDENQYLDQNKFRNWMQGVLVKALESGQVHLSDEYHITCGGKTYTVNYKQSNPAFTLLVRKSGSDVLDIDLVPCLMFDNKTLRGFRPSSGNVWIAIAKPLRSEEANNPNLLWRAGFYQDEKRRLKGHIKPIIRMVKTLRDVQNWESINSYYIETLFLHELENNNEFKNEYKYVSRTCTLIYMLRKLQKVLEDGELFNFWHPEHNLFEKMAWDNLQNLANQLQKIIKHVDDDPTYLENIFNSKFIY